MKKQYTKQFKMDAIKYRNDHPELSNAAVCRNLDVSEATFYKWAKQVKENNGDINHRGSGNFSSDLEKENARLKKELASKEDALRSLRKAISILGEEPK